MNTFALILLAWPLYLAINGKLVEFFSLATKDPATPPPATPTKRAARLPTLGHPEIPSTQRSGPIEGLVPPAPLGETSKSGNE